MLCFLARVLFIIIGSLGVAYSLNFGFYESSSALLVLSLEPCDYLRCYLVLLFVEFVGEFRLLRTGDVILRAVRLDFLSWQFNSLADFLPWHTTLAFLTLSMLLFESGDGLG